MSDISLTEYLRQVTLRKPEFQKALRDIGEQFPPPHDWVCPPRGVSPEEWDKQKREFFGQRMKLMEKWAFITPGDVGLSTGQSWPERPKVYLAFSSPFFASSAVPDGFWQLHVHESTTGDELKRTWQRIRSKLPRSSGRVRQRAGNLRDRIKVWDLYLKESNFHKIACKLQKPVSTVKALYYAARYDILGALHTSRRSRADSQAILIAQVDFDNNHFETCPQCSKAATAEEFCAPYSAYVTQDARSLRERLSPEVGACVMEDGHLPRKRQRPKKDQ